MVDVLLALRRLGFSPARVEKLAGDASTRTFYRLTLAAGETVVACEYPAGAAAATARDVAVQRWALERALPVPRLLAAGKLVVVSEDVGSTDLEGAMRARGEGELAAAIAALVRFQRVAWHDAPTAPFDAALFRRELADFEESYAGGALSTPTVRDFLDRLAVRLAGHPYRLVHRDFHCNNLFQRADGVWAVDFQDLRGGPDTYDLASLLNERAAAELVGEPVDWAFHGASALGLAGAWRARYVECVAQRGLKVLGTFLRLHGRGRRGYLRWVAGVRERACAALAELDAPRELTEALRRPHAAEGL